MADDQERSPFIVPAWVRGHAGAVWLSVLGTRLFQFAGSFGAADNQPEPATIAPE